MRRIIVCVSVALLVMAKLCWAHDRFSHLTIKEGLSQSTVKAICQDADGYLWIGTADGLNRYDGYRFESYYFNPVVENSLPSNDISCLYLNNYDSTLWIGTHDAGFAIFNKTKNEFSSYKINSPANNGKLQGRIRDMVTIDGEILWIASDGQGIYGFDLKKRTFIVPDCFGYEQFNHSNCFEVDDKGTLWIGTRKGLYYWTDKMRSLNQQPSKIDFFDGIENINVTALEFDAKGNLYVGTNGKGLLWFHPNSEQIRSYKQSANVAGNINKILMTNENVLFIATNNGVYRKDAGKKHFTIYRNDYANPESISDNYITTIIEDKSGIIWMGSLFRGVCKLDPYQNRFPGYNNFFSSSAENLKYNNILYVFTDEKGSVWLNTRGGLIELKSSFFSENDHSEVKKYFEANQVIGNIHYSKDTGLLIGLNDGINIMKQSVSLKKLTPSIQKQTGEKITSFITGVTDSDGLIWLSTNSGLLKYNPKNDDFKLYPIPTESIATTTTIALKIIEDYSGYLVVGTNEGTLFKFNRHLDTFEQMISDTSLTHLVAFTKIFTIYESLPGVFWIGTNCGLYRYDDNTKELSRFLDSDGLANNTIYGILGDKEEKIWCSTNKGISVYNQKTGKFQNYTYSDGLQSSEFNQDAYHQSEDGRFFMGGIEGLNIFRPEDIKTNNFIPPVIIKNMEVQYKPVSFVAYTDEYNEADDTKRLILSHKQGTFSFEYATLCYSQPEGNRYQYILEGYDNKWLDAGSRRVATYTNIPPGDYTFKVKGANSDGIWSNTPAFINITIRPPLWGTVWVRLAVTVLLGGGAYLAITLRIRGIKQQKQLWEQKVKEKTEAVLRQKSQIELQNKELTKINNKILEKNDMLHKQHRQISEQRDNLIKMAEEIKNVNNAKIKFFTTISHEFRTPLTLIVSPLKEMIKNIDSINKKQLIQQLNVIHINASKLLVLINQLLDLNKIETTKTELNRKTVDFVNFVKQIAHLFNELAFQREINYLFTTSHTPIVIAIDNQMMERAIINLISNAFKYTGQGGTIAINTNLTGNDGKPQRLVFSITDTGEGIAEDRIPNIFKKYYQSNSSKNTQQAGSGLGLAIAKSYINMHGGKISVSSKTGEGSTFTIELPLKENGYVKNAGSWNNDVQIDAETETVIDSSRNCIPVSINEIDTIEDWRKKELLLIEDDENLSWYLKYSLCGSYRILSCNNVEEGLKLVRSKHPELVICDIMIPGMNGLEFVKELKSDINVSDIPVILLTALGGYDNQLKGLEFGADDYITKPFDLQHLRLKIKNLIETKRKVQIKNVFRLAEMHDDKRINEKDVFIKRTVECIMNNISDSDLDVNKLCEYLGVSHAQMYRRIKSLTNLSISEFIRNIRLKKAAELLSCSELKINEIAWNVGFNDPNYFTRCFSKVYGQTPKNYIKKVNR